MSNEEAAMGRDGQASADSGTCTKAGEITAGAREVPRSYWLTRWLFLRLLGLVYAVAFLSLYHQLLPLFGAHGIRPAALFMREVAASTGDGWAGFARLPTLMWVSTGDTWMQGLALLGLALSLMVLAGATNALLMAALWFLYMSFVHVGQEFYGFGWEILLLETGFLAIFLCPWRGLRPFAPGSGPSPIVIWLLRWLLFRVVFGAGLIKIRGDSCWSDLTCLAYHYETQPVPGPLSWYLHQMPLWFHKGGVLFNHLVELVAPWLLLGPWWARLVAGILEVLFQAILIASGNLSFLNWLTLAIAVASFDDAMLRPLFPATWRAWSVAHAGERPGRVATGACVALAVLVAYLSIGPIENMASREQIMNTSFDRLHLVNTYGAFGSVGRERLQIELEGTRDAVVSERTAWHEYGWKAQPGDVSRRPPVITPYHYRVDWEVWFAAMSDVQEHPWMLHLIAKLLRGDAGALSLMGENPFPDAPPRYIRVRLYIYAFTRWSDHSKDWWTRRLAGEWLPPLSLDDPRLRSALAQQGWDEP